MTNIFESSAQTLVNPVNTVGVMGKGLAAAFKERYPENFRRYVDLCKGDYFRVGQLYLHRGTEKWVLNFPTKADWRHRSRVKYLEAGLHKFADRYRDMGITSVSFPKLGCGNGGLDWERVVRPLMTEYLGDLSIPVFVHLGQGAS